MSSEPKKYKLRRTPEIPALYDVLTTPSGKIIDGNHRVEDPMWPKKVIPGSDDPIIFWAVKLQAHNRRLVSEAETANDLIQLKNSLIEKRGKGIRLIPLLAEYSNMSPDYISGLLAKYDPTAQVATLPKPKSKAKATPVKEEVNEEGNEPAHAAVPEKGTEQFNEAVQAHIRSLLGETVEEMTSRLHARFELSEEDAKMAITSFKIYEPGLWSRIYDANDQPRQAQPKPTAIPSVQRPSSFTSDTIYRDAFDWYPDVLIEKVWSRAGAPSEKREFMRALFGICYEKCLEGTSEKELFELAIKQIT